MKQSDEIQACETQSAYVIVNDADVVYARAKAAGAEILLDIKDADYGGRGFSCRDLEGHIWNFGTFDPWPATELRPRVCDHCDVEASRPGAAAGAATPDTGSDGRT